MRLLNIDEKVPDIFYVFVGQGKNKFSEINYHNYKLSKKIISSGFNNIMIEPKYLEKFIKGNIIYTPFIPTATTFTTPSSHMLSVVNGYNVEYILEYIRDKYYKTYPSRLSCVYAFGDYESVKKASKLYGWDLNNVKKFKLLKTNTYLDNAIKVVKCNMEIVTLMWQANIVAFDKKKY